MRKVMKVVTTAEDDAYFIGFSDEDCVYENYENSSFMLAVKYNNSDEALVCRSKNREIHKRERRNL